MSVVNVKQYRLTSQNVGIETKYMDPVGIDNQGLPILRKKVSVCSGKNGFHDGCRYRTYSEDYEVAYPNTDKEDVSMSFSRMAEYQVHSTLSEGLDGWMHLGNVSEQEAIEKRSQFTPCPYYDQLNKGRLASHTIFNYANFLIFIRAKKIGAENYSYWMKGIR